MMSAEFSSAEDLLSTTGKDGEGAFETDEGRSKLGWSCAWLVEINVLGLLR